MAEAANEPEQNNTSSKPCEATRDCPKGGEHPTGSGNTGGDRKVTACTGCAPEDTDNEGTTGMLNALLGDPEKVHNIYKYTTYFTAAFSVLLMSLALGTGFAQFYVRQGITDYAEILPRTAMMVGWWFAILGITAFFLAITSNMDTTPFLKRLKGILKAFGVLIPMVALGIISGALFGATLDDKAATLISDTSFTWAFILGITMLIAQLLTSQFFLNLAAKLLNKEDIDIK
jgi:hypothetical protein